MKTIIQFTIVIIIFLFHTSFAQLRIGMQGGTVIPTGFLEDAVEVGFGGNLNFNYSLFFSNFELSASTGYYYCGFKEDLPDYNFTLTSIPLMVGAKINFTDHDFIPYIGFETGVYYARYHLDIDYGLLGKLDAITEDTHFGFAPMMGFRMNITPDFDIDFSARYNRIRTKYIARAFLLIQTGLAIRL